MNDCRLIMEKKDGRTQLQADDMGLEEMAGMAIILEQTIGAVLLHSGAPLEEVKSSMLDIHFAAMEALTQQVIRERSKPNGS